jgi:hypothetical protein
VCGQGRFKLTKWVSNSCEEHEAKQIKDLDLDREKLPVEKALGIQWNIESDVFTFRVIVENRPLTRRGISQPSARFTIHYVSSPHLS